MERAATPPRPPLVAAEPAAAAAAGDAALAAVGAAFPEHRQYPPSSRALPRGGRRAAAPAARCDRGLSRRVLRLADRRTSATTCASSTHAAPRAVARRRAGCAPCQPPDGALAAPLHSFSTGGAGHRGQRVTFTPRVGAAARARCGSGSTSPRPCPPAFNERRGGPLVLQPQARRRAASPSRPLDAPRRAPRRRRRPQRWRLSRSAGSTRPRRSPDGAPPAPFAAVEAAAAAGGGPTLSRRRWVRWPRR